MSILLVTHFPNMFSFQQCHCHCHRPNYERFASGISAQPQQQAREESEVQCPVSPSAGKGESTLIPNKLPERDDDTILVDSDIDMDELGSFAEDNDIEWSDGTPDSDFDMPHPSCPSAPEPEAAAAGSSSASPVGEPEAAAAGSSSAIPVGEPEAAAAGSASASPVGEPSKKKQKLPGTGHIKVHTSPEHILCKISPLPGCMISLNNNDRRWVSKWRKNIKCEQWIDELQNQHYSQVFTLLNWQDKLKAVHAHAWTKWELSQPYCTGLKLPAGVEPQTPGEVPQHILDELAPRMMDLPAKKSYYAKR